LQIGFIVIDYHHIYIKAVACLLRTGCITHDYSLSLG